MPRVTLPQATTGELFDSWDPRSAGNARAYWVGTPPQEILAPAFAEQLLIREMLLHVVTAAAPDGSVSGQISWLIDGKGDRAEITIGDVMQSNGVIQVINTVLLPS